MRGRFAVGALAVLSLFGAKPADSQGYHARFDTRVLGASYRGLVLDSVAAGTVVTGADGAQLSAEGYAVDCVLGAAWCHYFRAGPRRTGIPWTGTADVTAWGFGVTGLSAHLQGRAATDLGSEPSGSWPGTRPRVQLMEAYAELARPAWTARLGRQTEIGRLGFQGFDGARLRIRHAASDLEAAVYGGWGLARGIAVPVTSPALNPLDDFQPRDRQLLFGVGTSWSPGPFDVQGDWRRAYDPVPGHVVEDRAALSATVRPHPRLRLAAGAEYDFANGWWGTADASLTYFDARVTATVEARRYRPFFDLWTIWGAFSPVPHRTLGGSVAVTALPWLTVDGRLEGYRFDDAEAASPLVTTEDDGWRSRVGVLARVSTAWSVDAGYRYERGVGASERHLEGGTTWRGGDRVTVRAEVASVVRPLELRFSEVHARWHSVSGDVVLNPRWRLAADLVWVDETRERPDAAAFSWDQLRASARMVLTFGSSADRLPPGRRRGGGVAQRPAGAAP